MKGNIRIKAALCKNCGLCIGACPKGSIRISKKINEKSADAAGAAAIEKARALPGDRNKWKIQIARTMVKRAILGCA